MISTTWASTFTVLTVSQPQDCRHKLSRISDFSFDFFNPRDQGKNRIRFVLEKQSTHDLSYWLNKNARKRPYMRRVKIEEN